MQFIVMLQYAALILSAILATGCQTGRVEPETILIGQERYPTESSWTLKYLDLPMFEGFPGVAEHGPVPTGFSGKFLVFNPLDSSRFYKILLAEVKTKRPPLPFFIG